MECMCFEVKMEGGPRVVVVQEKGGDRGVDRIGSGVNAALETTTWSGNLISTFSTKHFTNGNDQTSLQTIFSQISY